jgi:hypothetical protein
MKDPLEEQSEARRREIRDFVDKLYEAVRARKVSLGPEIDRRIRAKTPQYELINDWLRSAWRGSSQQRGRAEEVER